MSTAVQNIQEQLDRAIEVMKMYEGGPSDGEYLAARDRVRLLEGFLKIAHEADIAPTLSKMFDMLWNYWSEMNRATMGWDLTNPILLDLFKRSNKVMEETRNILGVER